MLNPLEILLNEARKHVEELSSETLKENLDAGGPVVLVDVREPHERERDGAIPGAILLPFGDVEAQIMQVVPDSGASIVCYCHLGIRSLLAAQTLQRLGYRDVRSLAGGFHAWANERGFPRERR